MKCHFNINQNSFLLQTHSAFIDQNKLRSGISNHSTGLKIDATSIDNYTRIIGHSKNNIKENILQFFSMVNNVPCYSDTNYNDFKNQHNPVITCIILLTYNKLFVKNSLIPSIIKNSKKYAIEIIVISNGNDCNFSDFENITLLRTDLLQVAKGYNAGIKAAKGKYIALFHDDCILDDKNWLEKSIKNINSNCVAVTSEFDAKTAKFVPFVIKTTDIIKLGYLNEKYFFGIEDLDLSYKIYSNNKTISNSINAIHFQGISTILLYIKENQHIKKLLGYNIIPIDTVKLIQKICLNNAMKNGLGHLTNSYTKFFFDKYKHIIKMNDPANYNKFMNLYKINDDNIAHETNANEILNFVLNDQHKTALNEIIEILEMRKKHILI